MTKPNKKNRMMKKLFTLFACAVTLFTACGCFFIKVYFL